MIAAPTNADDGTPRRLSWRTLAIGVALMLIAFVVLTLLDQRVTHALFFPDGRDEPRRLALKHFGDLRFWLVVAMIAFALTRDWRWPAALFGSAALAGGAAELIKLIVGRERPVRDFVIQNDAYYVFRPLFDGFRDGSNLGFPSSHAATAFGGAAMLALLAPRLAIPALVFATGCAVSRVAAGAHFSTDALAGAALGLGAALLIKRVGDRAVPGTIVDQPEAPHDQENPTTPT